MNRPIETIGLLILFLLCVSSVLSSQVPDSTMYPKVMGTFWSNLPSPYSAWSDPEPDGGWGRSGVGGSIMEEIYSNYNWQSDTLRFMRRFDYIYLGMVPVITWDHTYGNSDTALVCNSLNHVYFDTTYNHDDLGHGGSQQELLGKSKGGCIMIDHRQRIISSFDLHNISTGYFGSNLNEHHPKREVVDWLSPGWFAFAVGDTLVEGIPSETDTSIWIGLSDPDSARNFEHDCWGDSLEDLCAAIQESGYEDSAKFAVWARTYVVILPFEEELWGMELDDCMSDPKYEIMRVDSIDEENGRLYVVRSRFGTGMLSYQAGQEIRPIIWANPNNWGDEAFLMNVSTEAPPAILGGEGPFGWYDIGALFVRNHQLKAEVTVDYPDISGIPDTTFYLVDGIWCDTYEANGLKDMTNNQRQYLHGGKIDLNLDGIPDCPGGVPGACDSLIGVSWKAGYEAYFDSVRIYTKETRGDSTALMIITNGHPDTTHYKHLNGRHFEDTNGWFHDSSWQQVIARSIVYENDPRFVEPKAAHYFERDFRWHNLTNLAQMRLTLAISLIASDIGVYGTVGDHYSSRTPLYQNVLIEDYYDEYAVDSLGRGFRHPEFQETYWDTVPPRGAGALSDSLLLEARYYLGYPVGSGKVYGNDYDVYYREFDHGLVIAHLGICDTNRTEYDVDLDALDLEDAPWDNPACRGGCHFMRIEGEPCVTRYNDCTNDGEHIMGHLILVDRPGDDDFYGRGDGLILIKEGDGFWIHPDHPGEG